jgi:putative membrane protein
MKLNIQTVSLITVAVLGVASMQSCTPSRARAYNARTNVNANGLAFIKGAHEGGLTEIEASKIAEKNSTNKSVTDFAAMMIKDHSDAGVELDTIADHKYVFLKDTVNLEHRTILDSLAKKSGAAFDKAYIELMVKDHEAALELFEENTSSNYTDIADFAKKVKTKVEDHLKVAKEIQATLK